MDVTLLQVSYSNEEGRMTSLCEGHDINIDAVIQSIESLCLKLSLFGHEYILVTASHTNTYDDRQIGSAFGLKFLNDHKDLVEEFKRNSKGLTIVKSDVPFENLSCQEQSYPSVNKRKRTAKDAQIGDLNFPSYLSSASSLVNFQRDDSANLVEESSRANFNARLKDMIDEAVDRLENNLRETKQASSVDQSEMGKTLHRETPKSERFDSSDDDAPGNEMRERITPAKFCLSDLRLGMPIVKLKDISKVQDNDKLNSNLHNDGAELLSNQNRLADGEFRSKVEDMDLSANQRRLDVESDNDFENEDYDVDDNDDDDDDYRPSNNNESTEQTAKSRKEKSKSDDVAQVEGSWSDRSKIVDSEEIQFLEVGDKFECLHCHKLYATKESMQKHKSYLMQRRKKGKIPEQHKRDKSPISSLGLEYKVIRNRDGSDKYKCLHCQFVYSSKSNLNRHHEKVKRKMLGKELESSTHQVNCNTSMSILDAHKHTGSLDGKISEQDKSTVTASSSTLEYEVISNQDGSEKYKCLHCQFVYSNKSNLNRHHEKVKRKILAKELDSSTSAHCDKNFTSVTARNAHNCRFDKEISEQQKSTVSSSTLEYEVIHNRDGSEKYKCLHCQFVYSSRSNLNKHQGKVKRKILAKELENSTDLKCVYCDEEFTSTSTFDAHKCGDEASKSDTNFKCAKVGDSYKCFHCNEFFTSLANVKKHQDRVLESEVKNKGKIGHIHVTDLNDEQDGYEYKISTDENGSVRYECLHCQNVYTRMTSLRKHHRKVKRSELGLPIDPSRDKSGTRKFIVKRKSLASSFSGMKGDEKEDKDVSNLKCSDCDEIFDNLTAAKNHSKQNDHLFCTQCPICRQIFARESSVLVHAMNMHFKCSEKESMVENENEKVSGQCLICDEMIELEERIVEHLKFHQNDYSVICDSCPLRFNDAEAKMKHVMNCHHAPSSSVFSCLKCPQKFKYMFVLDAHDCSKSFEENMRIVNDRINNEFVCYVCKKNCGTNRKGYMVHLFTHNTVSLYKCHVCHKNFKQKNSLRKHLLCSHAAKKKYICHTCGKLFTHSCTLASHIKIRHLGIGTDVPCPVCGKILSSHQSLEKHMQTHSNTHKFMCDICGKGFHQKSNMTKHKQVHNENRPFECDRCGATFRLEEIWKSHMKRHLINDGAGPGQTKYGKILKCSYCGKLFPTHRSLTVHIRTHTNERPYPCTMCDKAFKENGKLRRHMRTHKEISDSYLQMYRPSFSALF